MASPQLAVVLRHLRDLAGRATAALDLPPAERLRVLRGLLNEYALADPACGAVAADVRPVDACGRPCEWLTTGDTDPGRRLLYVHGGSWAKGGLDSHRALSARLARATGCAVLAVDYRLAPEHPFPAGLEDCLASFRWVLGHGPEGPGRAGHVFVAGDSAGANLALACLLRLQAEGPRLPDAAVCFSPATDFTASGESIRTRAGVDPILNAQTLPNCAAVYLQHGEDLRNPLVSPLFGELAGLPPLLLQVGDAEILLDDSRRFAGKARAAGVEVTLEVWPEMPHVFQFFAPFLPEAVEAISHVADFLRRWGG